MVTKFVPLPDNDGGKQRALAVARRLARSSDLVLCAYDDGAADLAGMARLGIDVRSVRWEPGPGRIARGLLKTKSLSSGRFFSPALAAETSAGQRRSTVHAKPVVHARPSLPQFRSRNSKN